MYFAFLKCHLERQLPLADRLLEAARPRHPVLAEHPGVEAVVKVLAIKTKDYGPKAAITTALLAEARDGSLPILALLIRAYLPMLVRVLKKARRTSLGLEKGQPIRAQGTDVDLEQVVLESFLGAVQDFPGHDAEPKPCAYLRRETARRSELVARDIWRHAKHVALVELEVLDGEGEGRWEFKMPAAGHALRTRAGLEDCAGELSAILREQVGDKLPKDKLELVEATTLRGEELRAHVDRCYPHLQGEARERTYKRLQRQRVRTLSALRSLLARWRREIETAKA